MFGDEKLFGKLEQIIDDRKRLALPKFTNREPGEQILIVKDNDIEVYRIYKSEKISELFDKLNEKISNSKTKSEEIKNKKKLLELSETIIKCSKVDKSGRISMGETFKEKQKVDLIGANDHLILKTKK